MSLLDPIRFPELSREEAQYRAATMPTGFGEYLGAKIKSGFDFSIAGRATEALTSPSERFGPLPQDTSREDAAAMGSAVDNRRLTEDEWRKLKLDRPGLAYSGGGTVEYETARTRAFDERRYRDSIIARYQGGIAGQIVGFGAQMLGGLPSPENFLPFVGPEIRAAMAARMGTIGGHAAAGALDASIGTALADAVVLPDLARRGEDVGAGDFALDLALGAVTGGLLGTGGGLLARRAEGRAARTTMLAEAARAVRLDGLERQGDALELSLRALADDQPVEVGPVLAPADAALRRRLMSGAAIPEPIRMEARTPLDDAFGDAEQFPFPQRQPTLLGVIRSAGGIIPDSEIDVDWKALNRRVPGLVNKRGLHLDSVAQIAMEHGFLVPKDDVNLRDYAQELAPLLERELSGERLVPADAAEEFEARDLQAEYASIDRRLVDRARNELDTELSGNELSLARRLVHEHDFGDEDALVQAMTYAALRNDGGTFDGGATAEDFDIPFDDLPAEPHAGDARGPFAGQAGQGAAGFGGGRAPAGVAPVDDIARFVTDYVTREAEAARHPSIIEAESSVRQAPPKTGVEEAQRLAKDMAVDNPPELEDVKRMEAQGLLSEAGKAEMLKAEEGVADAEKWAAAFETLPMCVSRYA